MQAITANCCDASGLILVSIWAFVNGCASGDAAKSDCVYNSSR
jgi:hypothetical protein